MDGLILLLLAVHTLATVSLAGICWFLQFVHYPLMARIGSEHFVEYAQENKRRSRLLMLPLMALETVTGLLMLLINRTETFRTLVWVGLGLILILWLVTLFVSFPVSGRLSKRFDRGTWRWLVNANWIRTIAWSMRAFIVLLLVVSL